MKTKLSQAALTQPVLIEEGFTGRIHVGTYFKLRIPIRGELENLIKSKVPISKRGGMKFLRPRFNAKRGEIVLLFEKTASKMEILVWENAKKNK